MTKQKLGSIYLGMLLGLTAALMSGCGSEEVSADKTAIEAELTEDQTGTEGSRETAAEETTGLAHETAKDGHIDFDRLQQENPDIFAWLYVPGTEIDYPVLQSAESDEFYIDHTADGGEGEEGALYTEMPNMMNMCDFNTIIHGKDTLDTDLFGDLHRFEDPDFFEKQEKFYIYLSDNVLTYQVFAAYYDDSSDILRRYDYTTYAGCEEHLQQIYGMRDMSKNLREGWDDLTPYHFLVTLDGERRDAEDRQYVVIGVLIADAAGTIDRVILE